jgi:hypothetical protein
MGTPGFSKSTTSAPALAVLARDTTLLYAAVVANEDAYTSPNFDDLVAALGDASTAINAAAVANDAF